MDAPYDCNAGTPYEWYEGRGVEPWEIVRVAFAGPFEQPNTWTQRSPYSVDAINRGAVPWLAPDRYAIGHEAHDVSIPAGTSLSDFIRLVEGVGGKVYLPRLLVRELGL